MDTNIRQTSRQTVIYRVNRNRQKVSTLWTRHNCDDFLLFRWKLQTKEDGSRDILGEEEGENEEDDDGEDGEEEEVDDGEGGEDSKAVSSERNGDIVLRENPDLSRNYKSQYLKIYFIDLIYGANCTIGCPTESLKYYLRI